jgi:serine/threonine-protein kinase RsbW
VAVASVELTIPALPEFVGVARLTILGIASRMSFSFDQVEDIRLAVGEACARSIERLNGSGAAHTLSLRYRMEPRQLVVEVRSPLRPPPPASAEGEAGPLADVLIRVLMDEVSDEDLPAEGVHLLRLVKRADSPVPD